MMPDTLTTERLLLRIPRREDAPALHRQMTWPVVRWLSTVPWPLSEDDVAAHIAKSAEERAAGRAALYAVTKGGEPIGLVGIAPRNGAMNLGYWLGEKHWGQGLMPEAAAAVIDAYFACSRAVHIASGLFAGNEASLRVQQKLGFVVVGEGLVPARPHGRMLPHYDTILGRARWTGQQMAA
ncbi:GNAT family N-acetyltransferase [Chelatococcus composti]|jgi:RimJ/RimL family protein N-acetyltransferase|uniref:RimJ/RimL family protein N-acetyltransferase n=1 Tax=Chelatococcus composti TaxID=1743235 RepID=A0A841KIU0_9HYPH|nr:GNAT family N-acetyltransferase [Chelatococcus composti]MBB6169846.1 RimJ/RimL family protein N-acetyltransferase [Chelatococcus composti]MBS7736217.1 GNAT family N-acetyltransferase [Chelatococcus composti]PZN39691.1 MAG: GNAT family N-acetyltransferase [Pseudomonadota bacterium]